MNIKFIECKYFNGTAQELPMPLMLYLVLIMIITIIQSSDDDEINEL